MAALRAWRLRATLIMMLAVEPRLGMEPTYYWDALTSP